MEIKIEITCKCGSKSMEILFSNIKEYTCVACGSELFKAYISNGYVYVLSNPSMPNLLKIGYTERDVDERVEELNSTGVPVPFETEAIFGSPNAYEDEQAIHNILEQYRLANNREFFSIDIKEVVQCIIEYMGFEPSFLKSPELLMSEEEKKKYEVKLREQTFDEIQRLEKLRTRYLSMAPAEEKTIWDQVILQMVKEKSYLNEEQKESYSRFIMNHNILEEFNSTVADKQDMQEWLDELETLRRSYYGYQLPFEFLQD